MLNRVGDGHKDMLWTSTACDIIQQHKHTYWFHLPEAVKILLLSLSLSLCFLLWGFFSFQHHMFLFKPKHSSVMAECHRPSIEPVNGDFDPWPVFWQPFCVGNSVDFAIECVRKWGQVRVILAVCVCVWEDLAVILHAWCLYLASPSLSLSLPLFLSLYPYVDVSAYLGLCLCTLFSEQEFCILISLCSLCLFMHSAVCQWFTTRGRYSTYGARWAQIYLVLWADLSGVVLSFVIKLSWLITTSCFIM